MPIPSAKDTTTMIRSLAIGLASFCATALLILASSATGPGLIA